MSKIIRDNIVLATEKDINLALKADAQSVSSDINSYIRQNELGYYIGINTWLLQIRDYSPMGWIDVKDRILTKGFLATIGYFNDCAQEIVESGSLSTSSGTTLARAIMRDISQTLVSGRIGYRDGSRNVGLDPLATTLQLFRYAKRFTPLAADKLNDKCISEFIATQNRVKLLQRRGYSQYFTDRIRSVVSRLPWNTICEEINNLSLCDIVFTHGVGLNARASLASKLEAIEQTIGQPFFNSPWNYSAWDFHVCEGFYGPKSFEKRVAEVRSVPKSYKASRTIAMEDTYRQALAKRVFLILDRYLPDNIKLHDQSINQKLAKDGSVTGMYATLDLSKASDSVSRTLVMDIFPNNFIQYAERLCPTHFRIGSEDRLLYAIATMGNSLTFVIESIVFWAICEAVRNTVSALTGEVYLPSQVYGDDIVVDIRIAETVMEWLTALGFEVNHDKSFISGSYRESCGEEFFDGMNVSSLYFPRFAIRGSLGKVCSLSETVIRDGFTDTLSDSTTRLMSLQHKLAGVNDYACRLVTEVIREAHPDMTQSLSGSDTQDLWGNDDRPQMRRIPLATIAYTYHSKYPGIIISRRIEKIVGGPEFEAHCVPCTIFESAEKVKPSYRNLYDMYRYNRFLQFGPNYPDRLSELLRVSDPDVPLNRIAGRSKIVWKA
jgi:hypothetical protein